jgi:DNA-binding NtrC family response regulator
MTSDTDATDISPRVRALRDAAPGVAFVMTVEEGPDRGQSFRIEGPQALTVLVGTSPLCEVRLTDRRVSRRHAALNVEGLTLRIGDEDSTNGTYVNGLRVAAAWLRGGERFRVGDTTLRVEVAAPAGAVDLPVSHHFGRLVGGSPEMRRLHPLCERLAATVVPVLIEGETGTGKELLAEALHEEGPRASGPFVVFDCTAVQPTLVESELFGHERGSFTGAVATRKGVFEQAHGGTLLIDEIGDLDGAMQPKLLRAIERSEVRRVGGDRSIRVDVRLLCATRRALDHEVQAGRFRDDLFHRLAVARIELPPLRKREGDVVVLARAFCKALGGDEDSLPADLLARWEEQSWPGNVRELRNAVARRLALGDLAASASGPAPVEAEPIGILEGILSERLPFGTARRRVLEAFERRYVEQVLAQHGGNVLRAAAASGVARRQFQRVKGRVGK